MITKNDNEREYLNKNQEVHFHELIEILWNNKISLSISGVSFMIIGIILSLSMQNIYESKAILSPAEKMSQPNSTQGLIGITGFSGFNISSSGSNVQEGIEILRSYNFFRIFLETDGVKEDLLAIKKWNRDTNTIFYDEGLFNAKDKVWRVEGNLVPSSQDAYFEFQKIFSISQDPKTNFVTLTINHRSPYIAKDWLERIIFLINETSRNREAAEARRSIDYLMLEMEKTDFTEIKKVLSELVKNQIQIAMLADSNTDFLFKVIEPPIVPEYKKSPQRTIIVLLVTVLGLFAYSIVLVSLSLIKRRKI